MRRRTQSWERGDDGSHRIASQTIHRVVDYHLDAQTFILSSRSFKSEQMGSDEISLKPVKRKRRYGIRISQTLNRSSSLLLSVLDPPFRSSAPLPPSSPTQTSTSVPAVLRPPTTPPRLTISTSATCVSASIDHILRYSQIPPQFGCLNDGISHRLSYKTT